MMMFLFTMAGAALLFCVLVRGDKKRKEQE